MPLLWLVLVEYCLVKSVVFQWFLIIAESRYPTYGSLRKILAPNEFLILYEFQKIVSFSIQFQTKSSLFLFNKDNVESTNKCKKYSNQLDIYHTRLLQ